MGITELELHASFVNVRREFVNVGVREEEESNGWFFLLIVFYKVKKMNEYLVLSLF
jgi:hypothetical protein